MRRPDSMRRLSEQHILGVCVKGAEQLADGDELALLAFSPADGAIDERKEALDYLYDFLASDQPELWKIVCGEVW